MLNGYVKIFVIDWFRVRIVGWMAEAMRVVGCITRCMVRESTRGRMEESMRESTKRIKSRYRILRDEGLGYLHMGGWT